MMSSTIKAVPLSRKKSKGRTFRCSGYPDCNMTFTRSEHLARHIRKHTGERPFECIHCSRKFSRLDNLRQHKQTVHAHEQVVFSYPNGKSVTLNKESSDDQSQIYQQPQSHIQQSYNDFNNKDDSNSPITSHFNGSGSTITLPLGNSDNDHSDENEDSLAVNKESSNSATESAPTTLLRPTQFRSKHRPRPLALPSRQHGANYSDAPYTVPTPRSSNSTHFVLSPISPVHSIHHLNNISSNPSNLPSFQFLTSSNLGDSLISPYSASFSNSISNNNTPLNSSFDPSVKTPTNSYFSINPHYNNSSYFGGNNHANDSIGVRSLETTPQSINSIDKSFNNGNNRKSWLNNVLNNSNSIDLNSSFSLQRSPNTANTSPGSFENKKVRIENLLNNHGVQGHGGNGSNFRPFENHLENSDRIKLPHVDTLGISKN